MREKKKEKEERRSSFSESFWRDRRGERKREKKKESCRGGDFLEGKEKRGRAETNEFFLWEFLRRGIGGTAVGC